MPQCRPLEGLCHLDGGQELYALCLRYHLSLDMSPQEVHDVGQREVAQIRSQMEQVRASCYNVERTNGNYCTPV